MVTFEALFLAQVEAPKPKGPKGVMSYRDASHLARLSGQLVALLQEAQVGPLPSLCLWPS